MKIERTEDINSEVLENMTQDELVELKVTLSEMIDEIDSFLEEYDK